MAHLTGHFLAESVHRFFHGIRRIEGWFAPVPEWWTACLQTHGFRQTEEPQQLAPCFKIFDDTFSGQYFADHLYYTMGDSDLF